MKHSTTCAVAAALLSCSLAYCDLAPESAKPLESQHHRVYAGPDIFVYRIQHHSKIFEGLRAGYDYVKPESFYFGMDGLASVGQNLKGHSHTKPFFANLEQRYGYAFQSPLSAKSTITPFAGIGWYYDRAQFNDSSQYASWLYGAAGLRIVQQFSENFDIGFNVKAMYAFAGNIKNNFHKQTINNAWGYEMAMPLTWHVGSSKKWDLQLQPYLLQLNVNNSSQIVGTRLQAGYSF